MSIAGWHRPGHRQEIYTIALLARVMNFTRGKDEPAFAPDWPWPLQPTAADVTDTERAALKAQLNANSAFAQKRTET